MPLCGIIVPRQENIVSNETGYLAECILPKGHFCPHVIKTPGGKYFQWKDDMNCGCCTPEEDDRCYEYWEITEPEVRRLLKGRE